MARQTTVDICNKIKQLLKCDIEDSNRLAKLDSDIFRLTLLMCSHAKLEAKCKYEKFKIFGYSQITNSEQIVEIDKNVLNLLIRFYEEEYKKQLEICKDIIRKLETT